jgi:hypothetical protein
VVESQLPKLLVAGSIPVSRSILRSGMHAKDAHRSAKGAEVGGTLQPNELRMASRVRYGVFGFGSTP